jgi:hypothetical protein
MPRQPLPIGMAQLGCRREPGGLAVDVRDQQLVHSLREETPRRLAIDVMVEEMLRSSDAVLGAGFCTPDVEH